MDVNPKNDATGSFVLPAILQERCTTENYTSADYVIEILQSIFAQSKTAEFIHDQKFQCTQFHMTLGVCFT